MIENAIPLSDMIQHLREELEKAQEQGKDFAFKFAFESVELELSVAVTNSGTAKGGIKFWVLDAGAEYQKENASTHKFTLVLKPGSETSKLISQQSNVGASNK